MSKKLTKEQLIKKKNFHKNRVSFYKKKIENIEKSKNRIGFKWHD